MRGTRGAARSRTAHVNHLEAAVVGGAGWERRRGGEAGVNAPACEKCERAEWIRSLDRDEAYEKQTHFEACNYDFRSHF